MERGSRGRFGERLHSVSHSWLLEERERAFTVVVNHEFDIAENLAVSSVCLVTRLRVAAPLPLEDALRLGIEDKGHGKQALDPF